MLKKILLGVVVLLVVAAAGGGIFVWTKTSAFDASMAKQWDVPLPAVAAEQTPTMLARGKHLYESLGGCHACHGAQGEGGKTEAIGPVATFVYPNITAGKNGTLGRYSDAQLARLIRNGVKADGTSVRFMPSVDWQWWPKDDLTALVSYLRSMPPADGPEGVVTIGTLGKVLDRLEQFPLDQARRIDHAKQWPTPVIAPDAAYGASIAKLCQGCHGEGLSGGPIPGAPPDMPVPQNLTHHETGMKDWSFEDFDKLMRTGVRKNGQQVAEMMPIVVTKNFDETEMKALWAYLREAPPKPSGGR